MGRWEEKKAFSFLTERPMDPFFLIMAPSQDMGPLGNAHNPVGNLTEKMELTESQTYFIWLHEHLIFSLIVV